MLAVTHGGTARSLIDLMLGLPVRHRHILGGLPNAGWSRLEEGRFGWRLAEHGVTADLGAPVPVAPVAASCADGRRHWATVGWGQPGGGAAIVSRRLKVWWMPHGAVAQLVAHFHGMEGVRGSNPLSST